MKGVRRKEKLFRIALRYVILVGLVLLTVTALTHAQGPNSVNGPSSILDEYKSLQNSWITKLLAAAQRLFFLLAGIEVACSFTLLPIERTDFLLFTTSILLKILFIQNFFLILLFLATP